MKRRWAAIVAAAALLAGCGMQQGTSAVPARAVLLQRPDASSPYAVLTSFTKLNAGVHPSGGLVENGAMLYGTTYSGGNDTCAPGPYCGVVYSLTSSGSQQVVYRFKGGSDGGRPMGRLLNVYGTLYGTTSRGGKGCGKVGCGTVFSVSIFGKKKTIYRFAGGDDGATPEAGLLYLRGAFWGTTTFGGTGNCDTSGTGCGTVFSVRTNGKETVLHRFTGQSDGGNPIGGLTEIHGTLYGTTSTGGSGHGTIFSITQTAVLKTLHHFHDTPDGADPMADLTVVGARMYGTTATGGADHKGTIFKITTGGVESVLYSFDAATSGGSGDDADYPVTYFGGKLYVATQRGGTGTGSSACAGGCGVLYRVTTRGGAKALHDFDGGSDGCWPSGGLVVLGNALYGETLLGGPADKKCRNSGAGGTVFTYTP